MLTVCTPPIPPPHRLVHQPAIAPLLAELRRYKPNASMVSLHSPDQGTNNCGVNTLQNLEVQYRGRTVCKDLTATLGVQGEPGAVNYRRQCLQDLFGRLLNVNDQQTRASFLRDVAPFMIEPRTPVTGGKVDVTVLQGAVLDCIKAADIPQMKTVLVVGITRFPLDGFQTKVLAMDNNVLQFLTVDKKLQKNFQWFLHEPQQQFDVVVDVVIHGDANPQRFQRSYLLPLARHLYIGITVGREFLDFELAGVKHFHPQFALLKRETLHTHGLDVLACVRRLS